MSLNGSRTYAKDDATVRDPPRSPADNLIRYLYAQLYQQDTDEPSKLIVRQSMGASRIFELRRIARKLKLGKIPIRIVFLGSEPHGWYCLHSLYRACVADPSFQVSVINIGWGPWLGLSGDCAELFQRCGIEYVDGMHSRYPLEKLNPDIIVTESPYDQFRPEWYRTLELQRYAKLVYISYGVDFAGRVGKLGKQTFGLDPQKSAWRIFSRSPLTAGEYQRHGGIPPNRIIGLGLPILDLYAAPLVVDGLPEKVKSASACKLKILYTPHHSLDGWSTFLRYGPFIRTLLQENEDWYLVFRPHPGLGPRLEQDGLMSQRDFRTFFPPGRSYLYDGDNYYDAFRWSDLLISDASSFLVQYAPTRRPVIYLNREDGWGIDDALQQDVFEGYYVARSEQDIAAYTMQLQLGFDPLAETRHRCQSQMSVGMFTADAGRRIAAYLHRQLA